MVIKRLAHVEEKRRRVSDSLVVSDDPVRRQMDRDHASGRLAP